LPLRPRESPRSENSRRQGRDPMISTAPRSDSVGPEQLLTGLDAKPTPLRARGDGGIESLPQNRFDGSGRLAPDLDLDRSRLPLDEKRWPAAPRVKARLSCAAKIEEEGSDQQHVERNDRPSDARRDQRHGDDESHESEGHQQPSGRNHRGTSVDAAASSRS